MTSSYNTSDIFRLLSSALILLNDKQIKVGEYNLEGDEKEEKKAVDLVDYIVRAVGNEMIDRWGETEESVKKALEQTTIDFSEFAYPKKDKGVGVYKNTLTYI